MNLHVNLFFKLYVRYFIWIYMWIDKNLYRFILFYLNLCESVAAVLLLSEGQRHFSEWIIVRNKGGVSSSLAMKHSLASWTPHQRWQHAIQKYVCVRWRLLRGDSSQLPSAVISTVDHPLGSSIWIEIIWIYMHSYEFMCNKVNLYGFMWIYIRSLK